MGYIKVIDKGKFIVVEAYQEAKKKKKKIKIT